MKQIHKYLVMFALSVIVLSATVGACLMHRSDNMEEVQLSTAEQNKFFAKSEQILTAETDDNMPSQQPLIVDYGAVAYQDGLVKQTSLILYPDAVGISRTSGYRTYQGTAVDHWYDRGTSEHLGVVTLEVEFEANGQQANVVDYDFGYMFEYSGSLDVDQGSTVTYSAYTSSRYGLVNVSYDAYAEGADARASIAVRCEKDGEVSLAEDVELI